MTPQGAAASVAKQAKLEDALNETFAQELSQVLKLLQARMRGWLRQLNTDPTGRLVAERANLSQALAARDGIRAALEEAGFGDLAVRAIDQPLDRLARQVLARAGRGADAALLTPFDVDALAALKELRLAELLDLGDDAAIALWRTTLDGVVGARSTDDLLADLADVADVTLTEARTLYDTAVSTYSRQVVALKADGTPDERFEYMGPLDEVTRKFCTQHVGQVLTREEIDALDNGQLPNVFLTGGGYNCRHQWVPVAEFS